MLCKKALYDGLSLELYTPFDFQPINQSLPFFFNSEVSSVGCLFDKQNVLLLHLLVFLKLLNILFRLRQFNLAQSFLLLTYWIQE